MDEYFVAFKIVNFDSHEAITKILGLKPDRIEVKGQQVANGHPPHTVFKTVEQNAWILESTSEVERTRPLQMHVEHLMARLSNLEVDGNISLRGFEIELAVTVYTTMPNPGFGISATELKALARLSAQLDIEFYFLGEE